MCSGTSRYGITSLSPSPKESAGENNYEAVGQAIRGHQYEDKSPINQLTVADLVYRLLTYKRYKEWASFASTVTHKGSTHWRDYISLEYIHNNLHVSWLVSFTIWPHTNRDLSVVPKLLWAWVIWWMCQLQPLIQSSMFITGNVWNRLFEFTLNYTVLLIVFLRHGRQ